MGRCAHLAAATADIPPTTPEGCAECLAAGTSWVALRWCLACGHVGCCDSSYGHATRHFESTSHPVMQTLDPGQTWRWCYVDEVVG